MEITTVVTFIKDMLATFLIMLTMISPASLGNKVVEYEAQNPEELVMSFAAVSDIHVETNHPEAYKNFSDVLHGIKAYKNLDAAAYLGDNVMNGQALESIFFYMGLRGVMTDETNLVAIGNHDSGNGDGDYYQLTKNFINNNRFFLENNIEKQYYYKVVNGCYMIVMASEDPAAQNLAVSQDQFAWLEGVLNEAAEKNAPIFVLNHFPVFYGENANQLMDLLNNYDNLLYLHGHVHNDLGTDNFTTRNGVNCINLPRCTETTEYEAGDGVIVEVYENEVVVRGRDFIKGEWIEELVYTYPLSK